MKTSYKLITSAAVCRVAEGLMKIHGTATNRDVKQALRADGFWAVQDDVAYLMDHLAGERLWQVRHNGRHHVYSLPAPDLYTAEFFLALILTTEDPEERRFWAEQYAFLHRH